MSKNKTSSKAAAPSKSATLKKVKDAGVTKPSQTVKSKSKDIAKNVAAKEEKKSKKDKKKVKEPTPEPSSSEEEEDEVSSESASSESESEVEIKKPAVNGGAKSAKKATPKDDSSDAESDSSSESDADSDSSSEEEAPAPKKGATKINGAKVVAKKEESSDSESDASSEDEGPAAVLGAAPAVDQTSGADSSDESESSDDDEEEGVKTNGAAKSDGSSESSEESEDDADSSSDSEAEEEPAPKVNKRKAEEQPERAIKKAKAEAETSTPSANPVSTNLFVGNLSWNVDDELLRSTFEEYGELTRVQVMYDRATNRAKGFGYVEFAKAEDATAAYEAKKGFELDGRPMNVDYSSRKPADGQKQEERRKSYGDQLSPPTSTLFVGNISFDAGQEQVSEAFSPYGTILSVRIPTSQETGEMKGYGYVTFTSVEEATAAIEAMQGAYIANRPVRLDYGTERPDRGDGGRGRGRGSFGGGFGGRGRGGDRGRGGRGGGRGFGDRGGRGGGRGASTNRGGFGDFSGRKQTFD